MADLHPGLSVYHSIHTSLVRLHFLPQAAKDALDQGQRAEEDAAAAAQVSLAGLRAALKGSAVTDSQLANAEEAVKRDVVAPLLHRLQEEQRQRQLLLKRMTQLQVTGKAES